MNAASRLTIERIIFYAMVVIMLPARFVPSAQASSTLGTVLLVLAFLYAIGSWWLLRRQGVWGFVQPFIIGWFGSGVPALWGVRMAGLLGRAVPGMTMALVLCVAVWIVAVWTRRKVENPLSFQFISTRMGLFMLCGLLYLI